MLPINNLLPTKASVTMLFVTTFTFLPFSLVIENFILTLYKPFESVRIRVPSITLPVTAVELTTLFPLEAIYENKSYFMYAC